MTEAELQAEVERQLEAGGWLWHHCPRTTRCHGPAGWPDLVAFRPCRVLAAELKSTDGRRSRAQERAAVMVAGSGAAYRLWTPDHAANGVIEHELKL